MKEDLTDISVALSTTGNLIITDQENQTSQIDLFLWNMPVCIAEIPLMTEEINGTLKENILREVKKCMQVVKIDPYGQSIFIGENPDDENTALVTYTVDYDAKEIQDFFHRWEETSLLLFECIFFEVDENNIRKKIFISIRGIWKVDKWMIITDHDTPMTTVQSEI
jgi:hypothetical protein